MPALESVIEKTAEAFARSIIAAVKGSSLQELLALSGGAPKRRGRPPKVKRGRKPGRPAKARKRAKKIRWPKCKYPGCKRNAWAQGKGYCGEHAKKKAKK
jgi:hypothetical protein